jgi:hypothetical protein
VKKGCRTYDETYLGRPTQQQKYRPSRDDSGESRWRSTLPRKSRRMLGQEWAGRLQCQKTCTATKSGQARYQDYNGRPWTLIIARSQSFLVELYTRTFLTPLFYIRTFSKAILPHPLLVLKIFVFFTQLHHDAHVHALISPPSDSDSVHHYSSA